MTYSVTIGRDDDAGVYYVAASEIPGLHAEAETADALIAVILDLVPELLEGEPSIDLDVRQLIRVP